MTDEDAMLDSIYDEVTAKDIGIDDAVVSLLKEIATLRAERNAAQKLVADQHDLTVALKNERDALRKALLRCDRTCETVMHRELERHGIGERCPVVGLIDAALAVQP